jgi:DedD protein
METGPKDRSRYTKIGTHTRQRLIGAIVLVAIVVIVVPELLTGPRSPPPPGATPQVRTVTIDLAASERGAIARSPPAPAPAAAAGPASATTAKPTALSPAAAPVPAPASAAPAAAGAAAPAAAPEPSAAPGGGAAPPPAASASGAHGWVVQLGSFAGRGNAAHLVSDLRGKGYAAFVSEYRGPGRVLYRVRVGPEPNRARVEAIAQRLANEGYRGSVAPQP